MKHDRSVCTALAVAACVLALAACGEGQDSTQTGSTQAGPAAAAACSPDFRMGMLVMTQARLFDNMVAGYRQGFSEETGIAQNEIQLDLQNAQGDPANYQSMARKFAAGSDDLIAVIGTPVALALAQATTEKPIVVISIVDPAGAGLVESAERPGTNITGSIDRVPEDEIVSGILEVQPDARKIGTIYTAGNDYLADWSEAIAAEAKRHGVELVETTITSSNELQPAARSMTGRVDALLIGQDGAVAAGLPAIAAEAQRNRLPVYLGYTGPGAVVPGVVAGYGSQEREVGRLAGEVAGQLCRGADAASTPFAEYRDHRWQFRRDALADNGLEVPPALAGRADFIED